MSKNEKELKDLLAVENLKKGESREQAYRRGYWDAVKVLRSEMGVLAGEEKAKLFLDKLDTYMASELILWKKGDMSDSILPPRFDGTIEEEKDSADTKRTITYLSVPPEWGKRYQEAMMEQQARARRKDEEH